ncbi:hypothetical protein AgCh_021943 [Apium graveolens]
MQAISSSLAKVSERSPTLDGEGNGVMMGSQGEPLMQEQRESERKADSMLRAKDAINSLPPAAGDDFELDSSGKFGDASNDEEDFMDIGGTQIALQATTNANTKSLLQENLESLHLHKIQSLNQSQDVSEIKTEIGQVKKDILERLEYILPDTIMRDINEQRRKDSDLTSKKLVAAQTSNPAQLNANKKGEKNVLVLVSEGETAAIIPISKGESTSEGEKVHNIQVSKVIVPGITFSKPPVLDSIDLIKIATVELERKEKWKKLDEKIEKIFGPIEKQDKAFSHFSQLRQILINEMSLGNMERDLVYETPKTDVKKLFGRSIAYLKDPRDSVLKKRIAKIYRNGKWIYVVAGHPQFAEARKEEKVRLKQQQRKVALDSKNQAKNPATIEFKMPTMIAESLHEEKQEKPKQTKKPRLKFRPKRKMDFDEDKEEYMPTQSTSTSQPVMPTMVQAKFKVYSDMNFHGEPIIPKDEPIDWESLSLPDLNILILTKLKKTKSRAIKKAKPVKLQSKALAKPKPTVNKGDQLFICDIKKFSDIDLLSG